MRKNVGHIDWITLLSVAGLMLFSVAVVYSASSAFADARFGSPETLFWAHAIRVFVGLGVILVFANINYRFWQRHTIALMALALGLLVYVFIGGVTLKGATRWISFGFVGFQPSEFAKFALALHLAALLAKKQDYIRNFKTAFLPMLLWISAVCALIALQPNLSTAFVIFAISMAMAFIGNVRILHLTGVATLGIAAATAYAMSAQYRMDRIMAFLGKTGGGLNEGANYQTQQALLAFGNGGWFGVGPGASRQRDWFLPESYGDFVFSIVGEEYGYIGALLVLTAFILIIIRGLQTARKAPDPFGRFLAAGITITIGIYALINAGVTTGLLPTTGLPMPFVSYGGTSIIFSAAAIGVLLNISAQAGVYPRSRADQPPLPVGRI